jgi:hypothetical protein
MNSDLRFAQYSLSSSIATIFSGDHIPWTKNVETGQAHQPPYN